MVWWCFLTRSPTRLLHAGDLAAQREGPEADAADAELLVVGARAPAQVAAAVLADLELRGPLRLHPQACPGQRSLLLSGSCCVRAGPVSSRPTALLPAPRLAAGTAARARAAA